MQIFRPAYTTQLRLVDVIAMATSIRAKESCTCLFVLKQDPTYCDLWTKEISLHSKYFVDSQQKKVHAWYEIP